MTTQGLAARIAGRDRIGPEESWTPVLDPVDQRQLMLTSPASAADVGIAVEVAHEAWLEWRHTSGGERAAALRGLAADLRADTEHLALVICAETGKLLSEARAEVDLSCRYLEWFASIAPTVTAQQVTDGTLVVRQPVGVVAAISTWNFPLSIPVRKLAPALAAGCSVVLKPSPLAPQTAAELVRRCEKHVPVGTVGLVLGGEEQGRWLVEQPWVKAVTFTGSTDNGTDVAARLAGRLTRSLLELGGRAPAVILPGADLERAAATVALAKFRNNGASCIAANNVFAHESLVAPLLNELADRVGALEPGDPRCERSTLGPMRTPPLARSVEALVDDAEHRGCSVVRGRRADSDSPCFTRATLVHADRETSGWEHEVYGPLLQVRGFRDETSVIAQVNGWQRGLGGYVVAGDHDDATRFAKELRIGLIGVGTGSPNSPELPFGGFDGAGWGREGSTTGVDPFLEYQSIAFGS